MGAVIPQIPDGSWPIYTAVEQFLLDEQNRDGAFTPTYDELGQFSRLAQDLRDDADHIAALAKQIKELIAEGVSELRNSEVREVA